MGEVALFSRCALFTAIIKFKKNLISVSFGRRLRPVLELLQTIRFILCRFNRLMFDLRIEDVDPILF